MIKTILFLLLFVTPLSAKTFNSSLGYSVEIPDNYTEYTKEYLVANMQMIIPQMADIGMVTNEEELLRGFANLEEDRKYMDQFVNTNNFIESINYSIIGRIPTFTKEEIENSKDEMAEIYAEQWGFEKFNKFEAFSVTINGRPGHRVIHDYVIPNFYTGFTFIEINNEITMRMMYVSATSDLKVLNTFIEEIENSIIFK